MLVSRGITEFLKLLMYALPIVILTSLVFFLKISDNLKGFLLGFLPTIIILALFIIDGYALNKHYMLFIPIAMVALYFEKKLILIHGVCLNVLFLIVYKIDSAKFLGPRDSFAELISLLILLNGALICFYFLNSWARDLVTESEKKEARVKSVLNELTQTFEKIRSSSAVMDENMVSITVEAASAAESSTILVSKFEDISTGSQEQAHSVNDINEKVISISSDINQTQDISEKITDENNLMMEKVILGEKRVLTMKEQMDTLENAIETAVYTVKDLESSMETIQEFLSRIVSISSQTNLLALNASIESARAGEAGRGFAVVAEEIRKLAEESSQAVEDINEIVLDINSKTEEAVKTVSQGNHAAIEGKKIIDDITVQYGDIKISFASSNISLEEEINLINQINKDFSVVHDNISNIASISEEQSASTEEVLETIEGQNTSITNLTKSLDVIDGLSKELLKLAETDVS